MAKDFNGTLPRALKKSEFEEYYNEYYNGSLEAR